MQKPPDSRTTCASVTAGVIVRHTGGTGDTLPQRSNSCSPPAPLTRRVPASAEKSQMGAPPRAAQTHAALQRPPTTGGAPCCPLRSSGMALSAATRRRIAPHLPCPAQRALHGYHMLISI